MRIFGYQDVSHVLIWHQWLRLALGFTFLFGCKVIDIREWSWILISSFQQDDSGLEGFV